ncbi:hypothetical protein NLG97_g2116 [Lecanicillium saksenae]|uniref:Uncharacterized protein n=1 Tax=Lecanicillium saksenae TaxID=468837 RepID=A0ACC1R332_9HYPO|nr:hypothetical protein NLG97_g2116 [Lecanicillium saksenae]
MSQLIETRSNNLIEAGHANGIVCCATNGSGEFNYTKALGSRTLLSGEKTAQQADDVLSITFATALITAIAALQCVEDGRFGLTEDVFAHAPEIESKQILASGFAEAPKDAEPVLEPRKGPITLESLLCHSSGVVSDIMSEDLGRWSATCAPHNTTAQLTVEETYVYPLGFQPGEGWMWGPGIDWVGRILERVTNKSLGDFVQKRVFAPLGITDAEFYPVQREDLQKRQVDRNPQDPEGYGKAATGGDGAKAHKGHFGNQDLFMTAVDFVKVLQSLLSNDEKLLKKETVDNMFKDHLNEKGSKDLNEALAGPLGIFFSPDIAAEVKTGHGLAGLVTLEDIEDGYGAGTLTWPGSMPLLWFIDRKNDLCGVVSTQAPVGNVHPRVSGHKHTVRKGLYAEYAAWREQKKQA